MRLYLYLLLTALLIACGSAPTIGGGDEETKQRSAQPVVIPTNLPPPLANVPVPEPPDLADYVADKAKAIVLGKALFWDQQIGSDGKTACATCHFHAGADSRDRNQISPGLLRRDTTLVPNPDTTVQLPGMNYRLTVNDFPLRKLADPDNRDSQVLADTNDIVSSQGVTFGIFKGVKKNDRKDDVQSMSDPDGFKVGTINVRRVEPRHTPTVINAVFNFRQFWDGRAQDEFNGVNVFGDRDPFASVFKAAPNGDLSAVRLRIKNASLASQAVGPPLSSFEMSADGRTFQDVGDRAVSNDRTAARKKKLMRKTGQKTRGMRPLREQQVSATDSVLGAYRHPSGKGLNTTYEDLIKQAFKPEWWKADGVFIKVDPATGERTWSRHAGQAKADEYTLMEFNFSVYFGLAVQLYEATLVSWDTPFDRFLSGDTAALNEQEKEGMALFFDTVRVRCVNCHGGAELTDASHTKIKVNPLRRREGNLLDRGFNNIGVRTTFEDIGVGDTDPFGAPLSHARLATMGMFSDPTVSPPVGTSESLGDDGAFKAPGLRNVALTAPYFHNGGTLTLRQVIEFYSRGGDFRPIPNRSGQIISPLNTPNLTENEKIALVSFLLSLTDERVRLRKAPFDHPEIRVPNGHMGDHLAVQARGTGEPKDRTVVIPAVGAQGGAALPNFLEGNVTDIGDED
jgi:cytochrome c peroxidase